MMLPLPWSVERQAALLDTLLDGCYVTDASGVVLYANRAMRRLLGYPEGAPLLGSPLPAHHWAAPHEVTALDQRIALATGIVEKKLLMRTVSGIEFTARRSSLGLWDEDGTLQGIQHLLHHLPYSHQRDTAELSAENRDLAVLTTMSATLLSTMGVEQTAQTLMRQCQELLGAERAHVLLHGEKQGAQAIPHLQAPPEEQRLIEERAAALLADALPHHDAPQLYSGQAAFPPALAFLRGSPVESLLLAPILAHEQSLGLLLLLWEESATVEEHQLLLLGRITQYAGLALMNARLYEDLQRAYEELQEAQGQLVEAERQKVIVEMAGAAAHELNQPLTVLLGYISLLSRRLSGDEGLQDSLERIERSTRRISEIVRRLGQITHYRTRDYVGGQPIVDIEAASQPPPP